MARSTFKFDLGDTLKEVMSGYEGVVMGRTDYLTGCNGYGLLSPKDVIGKDKKKTEWVWFDETLLMKTNKKSFTFPNQEVRRPDIGGPELSHGDRKS